MVTTKSIVNLVDEDGNVFPVMARCHRAAKKAGWTEKKWKIVEKEISAGDHDHALQTVMKHFDVE
ncbi:MAG: hypothetical protein V2B18_25420 [Pseudomonadota bacterium]